MEKKKRSEYKCRRSLTALQGLYGVSISDDFEKSWGSWIPWKNPPTNSLEIQCLYDGRSELLKNKPIVGYFGTVEFYVEDLKMCHYEYSGEICKRLSQTKRKQQKLAENEAFSIWELKPQPHVNNGLPRFALIWVNYTITDFFYNTWEVQRVIGDSLVNIVRYGLTDFQRKVFGIQLMDRDAL